MVGPVLRPRVALLVGVSDRRLAEVFRTAVHEAGFEIEEAPGTEQARRFLEEGAPAAILVNVHYENAEAVCLRARSLPRLSTVPIIGLTSELSDLSFPEVYGWGGDDIARLHVAADLIPRLRALSSENAHDAPAPRGLAIVADADRRRRIIVARVLRNSGFDVRFVLDSGELERSSTAEGIVLVVADAELALSGTTPPVQAARAANNEVPWVLMAAPKGIRAAQRAVASLARVAVTDSYAPPENVLFCANELGRVGLTDGRASARILYGTVVAFRVAGRDEDSYGFTYNVSAGGMYVRTLAPPAPGDEVWIELRPPRSDRRVRLEAKNAWRRRFGPIETATAPPGFGAQITDATKGDMARFLSGYSAFRQDVFGNSLRPT